MLIERNNVKITEMCTDMNVNMDINVQCRKSNSSVLYLSFGFTIQHKIVFVWYLIFGKFVLNSYFEVNVSYVIQHPWSLLLWQINKEWAVVYPALMNCMHRVLFMDLEV
jgi:hypothetical protein